VGLIEDGPAHLIDVHLLHLLRAHRAQLRTHRGLVVILAELDGPVVDLKGHLVVLVDDVIEDQGHLLQVVADLIGSDADHVLAVRHQQQLQLLAEADEVFQVIAGYYFV
jgi:phosphoribosylpyrophosphate synthetase